MARGRNRKARRSNFQGGANHTATAPLAKQMSRLMAEAQAIAQHEGTKAGALQAKQVAERSEGMLEERLRSIENAIAQNAEILNQIRRISHWIVNLHARTIREQCEFLEATTKDDDSSE